MVESYFIVPEVSEGDLARQSKWLLRIILNRAKLLDKDLNINDVGNKIKLVYGRDLAVVYSDVNADEQVVRIRLNDQSYSKDEEEDRKEDDENLRRFLNEMLDNLTFRGVPGVSRAFIDTKIRPQIDNDGSIFMNKEDPRCHDYVWRRVAALWPKSLLYQVSIRHAPTLIVSPRFSKSLALRPLARPFFASLPRCSRSTDPMSTIVILPFFVIS